MLTYKIEDRPGLHALGDRLPRIVIGGVDISDMVADYAVSAGGVSLTLHLAAVEATGMGVVYVRGVEAPVRAGIDAIRADCLRILEATGGVPCDKSKS